MRYTKRISHSDKFVFMRTSVALLGALLLTDAFALLGLGLFNFGVVLPLVVGGAFLAWAWKAPQWHAWLAQRPRRQFWWRVACCLFAAWLVSVALFFAYIAQIGTADRTNGPPRAILILGSGTPNCHASPTLAARLDKGAALAAKWPDAWVAVSGGQDWGRHCTEAQVMGDYLRAKGLSADRLMQEDQSTSTHENLRFSQGVLSGHGVSPQDRIAIVTSDFHTLRTDRIARRAGYTEAEVVGAPTPLYLRYNARLREYFAFISGWLLGEY